MAGAGASRRFRISVLVATVDGVLPGSLREALVREPTFDLTVEEQGVAPVMRAVAKAQPDVLVLDAAFVHMLAAIRLRCPATKVILLARRCNEAFLAEALQQGVRGCVDAHGLPQDWTGAIHAVHRGEMWIGRKVLASVLDDLLTRTARSEHAEVEHSGALSDRESQVADAVRLGLTNKEIARKLGISDATVKTHLESIFHKLNVTRRLQLAMLTRARDDERSSRAGEG